MTSIFSNVLTRFKDTAFGSVELIKMHPRGIISMMGIWVLARLIIIGVCVGCILLSLSFIAGDLDILKGTDNHPHPMVAFWILFILLSALADVVFKTTMIGALIYNVQNNKNQTRWELSKTLRAIKSKLLKLFAVIIVRDLTISIVCGFIYLFSKGLSSIIYMVAFSIFMFVEFIIFNNESRISDVIPGSISIAKNFMPDMLFMNMAYYLIYTLIFLLFSEHIILLLILIFDAPFYLLFRLFTLVFYSKNCDIESKKLIEQ